MSVGLHVIIVERKRKCGDVTCTLTADQISLAYSHEKRWWMEKRFIRRHSVRNCDFTLHRNYLKSPMVKKTAKRLNW